MNEDIWDSSIQQNALSGKARSKRHQGVAESIHKPAYGHLQFTVPKDEEERDMEDHHPPLSSLWKGNTQETGKAEKTHLLETGKGKSHDSIFQEDSSKLGDKTTTNNYYTFQA